MSAFEAWSVGVALVGWCLVHFVWQAAAIGGLYAIAKLLLPRGNARYVAAMLALLVLAACPVLTGLHEWRVLAPAVGTVAVAASGATAAALPAGVAAGASPLALAQWCLPWLVLAWALGVGVLGTRVFRQWLGLRTILREAQALPLWQARARQFADRLGLAHVVPVLASVRVATPTLVGWLRPAVVLPVAVLARMPAEQIDLVLAHELAHLKRLDHLANLFQLVLETLFFYHPVVHWISRDARNERELCCDALALRATGGQRRDFVAALANLEAFRAGHAELALAASGGVLAERARFIARAAPARPDRRSRGHVILVLAAIAVLGLAWMSWRDAAWRARAAAIVAGQRALLVPHLGRAAMPTLALPLALSAQTPSDVSPVPPALVAIAPAGEASVRGTPIRIASVGKPALELAVTPARLQPIVGPALAESVRTPHEATPAAAAQPRVLYAPPPVYPQAAMLAGIQGQVVVTFALDAAGAPHHLAVAGSDSVALDAAALQALAAWRFAPPATAGQRYRQVFDFRFGPAQASGLDGIGDCTVSTGTHICRHVPGAASGVRVLRAVD